MRLFTVLVAFLWTFSVIWCSYYKEASKLHMGLEVGFHQHRAGQDNPLPQMSAGAGVDALQDVTDITQTPSTVLRSQNTQKSLRSRDAWLELPISRCHKVYFVLPTIPCNERGHQQADVVLNAAIPLCSQSSRNTHMLGSPARCKCKCRCRRLQ